MGYSHEVGYSLFAIAPYVFRAASRIISGVPIIPVVVLGAEFAVVAAVAKEAAKGGAKIQLRFLPPYRGHLIEMGEANGKENINVRLRELEQTMAKEIAAINPSYPLGPYGNVG